MTPVCSCNFHRTTQQVGHIPQVIWSTAWVGSSHRWPDGPITSAPGCTPTHLDGSNEGFGAHQLLKADGDADGDGSSHGDGCIGWPGNGCCLAVK